MLRGPRSFNHLTIMTVMCTVWTVIDWLRQIRVIRFNTRGTIPNKRALSSSSVSHYLFLIHNTTHTGIV